MAAASVLGVALLIGSATGALAAAGNAVSPADFATHHLVKAGSFTELAEAVDTNGKVHIAAGDENDVWYLTNAGGSWTAKKVFVHTAGASGYLWGMPSITLDSANNVHIAALKFPMGEGGLGIYYATNKGHTNGSFGVPVQIAGPRYGEPQLKVYNGKLYLVAVKDWCCVSDGTVVMRTNKTGPWTEATIGTGQYPSFQMTSDGYARVAYERGDTAPGLYYAASSSHKGNFTSKHIAGTNANDSSVLLALTLYASQIAWSHQDSGAGSWKFTYSTSSGWHSWYTVPSSTASQPGAIAALDTGYAHIALAGVDVTDHERCGSVAPGTWCNDTVASNVHAKAIASAAGPAHTINLVWIQQGDIWYSFDHFPGP
jgi:hypothetical protein